jgi:hypothetical protein
VADATSLTSTFTSLEDSKTQSNPRCAKKSRRGREKPKLVILDEPEEV